MAHEPVENVSGNNSDIQSMGRGAEHHVAHPALSAGYPAQGQPGVPAYAVPQNPYTVGSAAYGMPGTFGTLVHYQRVLITPKSENMHRYIWCV